MPDERRWIGAAVTLGVGAPLIAGLGLLMTLLASLLIGRFLPQWAFLALWTLGLIGTCVPLWYLVGRCVDVGAWRTLLLGIGAASLAAIASYVLGAVTQAIRPGINGMAGTAWVFLGYLLGFTCLMCLVMGAIAIKTRESREAPVRTHA
jgi:hypothetical protein